MTAAGKASLVMLALLMAMAVQQLQAAPAAALRSGGGDWDEQQSLRPSQILHPTCDHDQFMTFMRLSCQYHRRRREALGAVAAAAEGAAEAEMEAAEVAAAADGGGVRVARSPSPMADLFARCCERPCNIEDFVGVCP